jgi:hypothetical protein
MHRIRTLLLAAVALCTIFAGIPAARAQVVVQDFSSDPARHQGGAPPYQVRGPGAAQFLYEPASPTRFAGDPKGSLAVTYDSVAPTSRFFTTLPGGFTQDDDFVLGAVITVRPEGFAPDPFGFHPISFSLFNSTTTGDERTGNLSDFRADAYDTVELSYFPNVSPFFGGPFLSPDLFGERTDPDAFVNFAFGSVQFELEPGVTYLIELEHTASRRVLVARVSTVHPNGRAVPIEGGVVEADLSRISAFLVDSLGITAYHDGFNEFSGSGRSLLATVDYDLLYCGLIVEGRLPGELERALGRLRRGPASVGHSDAVTE